MDIYFNKTLYKKFYKEIAQLLIDTGLSNKNRIQGCSLLEIKELKEKYNCKLPLAITAFFQVMGKGSGGLLDKINIYSIDEAKQAADELTGKFNWKLTTQDFLFHYDGGENFYYITLNMTDESYVYSYDYSRQYSQLVCNSFSGWIRELAIGSIELQLWKKENGGINTVDNGMSNNGLIQFETIINTYDHELVVMRDKLIREYFTSDAMNRRITGPIYFQKHWSNLLKQTKQYKELKPADKRLPWDWSDTGIIK